MPHAVTIAAPGLQALILCGPGSSFPTFTANPDENPKALLPIANRPMVWYPLEFCYRAGITDITLVCPPSAAEAITTALNTNPFLTSLPYPRPDLLSPKDLDQNTGTAEILRLPELQALVTSDFLVLPCDLVCELGADKLLQAWMVKSASLADLLGDPRSPQGQRSGGLGVWYQTKTATPVKGEETDFMATAPLPSSSVLPPKGSLFSNISNLVYSMPTDSLKDLLEEKNGFPVRHGLVRSHPRARMLTTHRDAHLYIFPRWVMEFVRDNDRLETIGEDVVGWWAKAGWQKGLSGKLGLDSIFGHDDDKEEEPSGARAGTSSPSEPSETPKSGGGVDGSTSPTKLDQARSGGKNISNPSSKASVPPMLAYVHPSQATGGPLIRRVDTSQLLLQVSLQLAKLPSLEEAALDGGAASPYAHARKVAYPEGVRPRTTITKADSLVAENVTVQEKTSIKECVIGANCQINEGAKLLQCLLMDGVVVGKNCKLTKCILGRRSEIGEGCVLTDCEVQENMLVEKKTEAKDEKFMSSSGLEATEQELKDFADEDEEDGGDGGEDDDSEA
ncbi:hypothetical protein B0H67DRAFT_498757 [Lasiosphaeris hirsuta]|uniref:Mannose-1-phosphate guanyltransferase n=1 Tax=Lasiosphaeris hirsuta TaxID=260670 RepID=A0AA40DM17_9PEZI|nr:hypothetical protein B0H67DRAFT_498757 [Lasiosphaeris hirsuta]